MDVEEFFSRLNAGETNFTGVDLRGACLIRSDLRDINLSGADLRNADLTDVDLARVNLMGANLSGAILLNANLEYAILVGADLSGADLECAIFECADLTNANLRNAINESVLDAILCNTLLPNGRICNDSCKHEYLIMGSELIFQTPKYDLISYKFSVIAKAIKCKPQKCQLLLKDCKLSTCKELQFLMVT